MPAADFRPAGASQYSTGGVCFFRSGPMSGPVRYLANACAVAFLSASCCSRTAMKPTPPHAVWSPLAFGKLAISQFFAYSQFLSALSTLIIALGRWRIAMSPLRNRAWLSFGFRVRMSGGMTFAFARATHFSRPLTASALLKVHVLTSLSYGRPPSMSMKANSSFACAKPYTCLPLLRLYVSFCAAAKNSSYVQLPSLGGLTPASLKRWRLMYSNHGTIQSGYATTLPLYVVAWSALGLKSRRSASVSGGSES